MMMTMFLVMMLMMINTQIDRGDVLCQSNTWCDHNDNDYADKDLIMMIHLPGYDVRRI